MVEERGIHNGNQVGREGKFHFFTVLRRVSGLSNFASEKKSVQMTGKPHKSIWKGIHKWVGAVMALLLSVFCLSGIILNHRGRIAAYARNT